MSKILNHTQKLFLIAALALSSNIHAAQPVSTHNTVLEQIHTTVEKTLKNNNINSCEGLIKALKSLKHDVLAIIEAQPNKDEQTRQLEDAFKKLNPENIADILKSTGNVIKHLDPKTKDLILKQIPTHFRSLLFIPSKK